MTIVIILKQISSELSEVWQKKGPSSFYEPET